MIHKCPSCGNYDVTSMWTEQTFPYENVNLTVMVLLHQCRYCDEYWLDYVSEMLVDSAIENLEANYEK